MPNWTNIEGNNQTNGIWDKDNRSYIGSTSSENGMEIAEANAARICRAINSNADLIQALESLLEDYEDGNDKNEAGDVVPKVFFARLAVAKAKGKV